MDLEEYYEEMFSSVLAKEIFFYFYNAENETTYCGIKIREWIESGDKEVLGVLEDLLSEKKYYSRIDPPLGYEDYYDLVMKYYTMCITGDYDGDHDFIKSSYEACWALVYWFQGFWDDNNIPRSKIEDLKKWIEELHINGDDRIKDCLLNGFLEHLFQNKKIAKFFSDWKEHPHFKTVYEDAMTSRHIKFP